MRAGPQTLRLANHHDRFLERIDAVSLCPAQGRYWLGPVGICAFNVGLHRHGRRRVRFPGGSMFESVGAFSRRCLVSTFGVLACSASVLVGTAAAQTTIVLNQAGNQVTDTTIRSGAYSNTNFDKYPLITRRSTERSRLGAPRASQVQHRYLCPGRSANHKGDSDAHGESRGSDRQVRAGRSTLTAWSHRSWKPMRPG